MGELFLVLIIIGIVCGAVPLLLFAYMNGKLNTHGRKAQKNTNKTFEAAKSNPKFYMCTALILGAIFGCFCFPVWNLTKTFSRTIQLSNFALAAVAYYEVGIISAAAFPYRRESVWKSVITLLGFNCVHILAGMGCRYLLEFGEYSNTYNFTVPNIVVHLIVVNVFCLACWYFVGRQNKSEKT